MLEAVRCLLFFAVEGSLLPVIEPVTTHFGGSSRDSLIFGIRVTFLISAIGCTICGLHNLFKHLKSATIQDKRHPQSLRSIALSKIQEKYE